MNIKEIDSEEVSALMAEGACMVDVREPHEVEQVGYDVPGLLQVPMSVLEQRYHEIPDDKPLIMACRSGARSMSAIMFLLSRGYGEAPIANLKGGILRWAEKGMPIKGTGVPQ